MSSGISQPSNGVLPSHAPASDSLIKLQVGEHHFTTTRATLAESKFFSSLLAQREDHALRLTDGSYFIDRDGKHFEHILRYLRGSLFPLFYDIVKGHDRILYVAILQEAEYYQIEKLQKWLADEEYLTAVSLVTSTQVYTCEANRHMANAPPHDPYVCQERAIRSDASVQIFPEWTTREGSSVMKATQVLSRAVFNWNLCQRD